jgi:hypothetical protein
LPANFGIRSEAKYQILDARAVLDSAFSAMHPLKAWFKATSQATRLVPPAETRYDDGWYVDYTALGVDWLGRIEVND